MTIRTVALLIAVFALSTASFAQSGGVQVLMMDGSVRGMMIVETKFPLATDPGTPQVRIAKLPARSLDACMASTDFSAAVRMDPRLYSAFYDAATGRETFSFGVEREMKESGEGSATVSSCHVVRFSACCDVDGRDYLVWQRGASPNSLLEGILEIDGNDARGSDEIERFIKVLPASSFQSGLDR